MQRFELRFLMAVLSVSVLLTSCGDGTFDRATAVATMEARLALKPERTELIDLRDDALRIIDANPADDAAFQAIQVVLKTNRIEDMSRWQGSPNQALQVRMTRVLLEHHLQRPDFLKAVYLNFSTAQGSDYVAFWNAVFERSAHREVQAMAARALMKHYAERVDEAGLPVKEREPLRAQVRHYAQIIQRDYADVGQLSREADGFLASLQHSAGATLPRVEVATLQGNKDALANYRGKVVLLDFWATWCGACRKDHPKLMTLKKDLAGKPFEIISVSVDEEPELVNEYLAKEHSLPWPQWYVGPQGSLLSELGISGYPTYFLVDSEGVVQARGLTTSLNSIKDQARELVAQIEAR